MKNFLALLMVVSFVTPALAEYSVCKLMIAEHEQSGYRLSEAGWTAELVESLGINVGEAGCPLAVQIPSTYPKVFQLSRVDTGGCIFARFQLSFEEKDQSRLNYEELRCAVSTFVKDKNQAIRNDELLRSQFKR